MTENNYLQSDYASFKNIPLSEHDAAFDEYERQSIRGNTSQIGRKCRIGFCETIYEIENYSSQHNQYLVRSQSYYDDELAYGWVDVSRIHFI